MISGVVLFRLTSGVILPLLLYVTGKCVTGNILQPAVKPSCNTTSCEPEP